MILGIIVKDQDTDTCHFSNHPHT